MKYFSTFGYKNTNYRDYLLFDYDWYLFNVPGIIHYALLAFYQVETTLYFEYLDQQDNQTTIENLVGAALNRFCHLAALDL